MLYFKYLKYWRVSMKFEETSSTLSEEALAISREFVDAEYKRRENLRPQIKSILSSIPVKPGGERKGRKFLPHLAIIKSWYILHREFENALTSGKCDHPIFRESTALDYLAENEPEAYIALENILDFSFCDRQEKNISELPLPLDKTTKLNSIRTERIKNQVKEEALLREKQKEEALSLNSRDTPNSKYDKHILETLILSRSTSNSVIETLSMSSFESVRILAKISLGLKEFDAKKKNMKRGIQELSKLLDKYFIKDKDLNIPELKTYLEKGNWEKLYATLIRLTEASLTGFVDDEVNKVITKLKESFVEVSSGDFMSNTKKLPALISRYIDMGCFDTSSLKETFSQLEYADKFIQIGETLSVKNSKEKSGMKVS